MGAAVGRVRTGIVVLALVGLSGCSSEVVRADSPTAAEETSSQAPSSEPSQTSGSPEPAEVCDLDEKTLLSAMESAMPPDATTRMSMEMATPSGPVLAFDAVLAYTKSGPEMELSAHGPGEKFAAVFVDDRVFISPTGEKGPYTELDASDPVAAQMREQVGSVDVTSSFDAWRAGMESVESEGEETVAGEPTCHYTLQVDTAAAMSTMGGRLPEGMPDTITYDLFLTPDDLIRRIRFDLGELTSEVNATRWNEPVTIEAPPTG
jgi:hypothetical protein